MQKIPRDCFKIHTFNAFDLRLASIKLKKKKVMSAQCIFGSKVTSQCHITSSEGNKCCNNK